MKDLQPINFPGLDPRRPLVIAGPCSAETEEQVIETARELAAEGVRIFRAGRKTPSRGNAFAKRMQTLPVPPRRAEPLPHRSDALCLRQNPAKPEP